MNRTYLASWCAPLAAATLCALSLATPAAAQTAAPADRAQLERQLQDARARLDDAARDVADLPVLGTLLAAGADYLITGDQDLLALADRHPILAPAEFWRRHGS